MKMLSFLPFAGSVLALAGLTMLPALPASAQALVTLMGTTPEARQESQASIRLSLLQWTEPAKAAEIVGKYGEYATSQDHEAFGQYLRQQATQGYLFTSSATGYTVKYAWQDERSPDRRTILLITPALKSLNPYMWKTANMAPAPFSLVELRWSGDEAVMKSSLDTPIELTADGRLQLRDYAGAAAFATLSDNIPLVQSR